MTLPESNRIAPLSELFLLLPDHRHVLLGESRRLGVDNEDRGLRRAAIVLSIAAILNIIIVFFSQVYTNMQSSQIEQQSPMALIGLLPAALMLIFLFFVTQRFVCKAKLEREGFFLPGEVIEAKADTAMPGQGAKNVVRLRYLFVTPDNRQITKEEAQVRTDLNINQLPDPGTPLAIMFASDSCFRVL